MFIFRLKGRSRTTNGIQAAYLSSLYTCYNFVVLPYKGGIQLHFTTLLGRRYLYSVRLSFHIVFKKLSTNMDSHTFVFYYPFSFLKTTKFGFCFHLGALCILLLFVIWIENIWKRMILSVIDFEKFFNYLPRFFH